VNTVESPAGLTVEAHASQAEALAVPAPRRNRLLSIVSVLWSPARTFRDFADGSGFMFALLAILILDIVLTLLTLPKLTAEIDKQLLTAPPTVAEMRGTIFTVSIVVVALMNTVVLAFAALLLTLATKIFRAKAGFAVVFSGLLLASVPTALGRLLQAVPAAFGNSADGVRDALSIAGIFGIDKGDALFPVANLILVFDVWTLVLVGLGYSIISGMRRIPAWVVSLSMWILLQSVLVRFMLASGPAA
jgi:hypothetical protein